VVYFDIREYSQRRKDNIVDEKREAESKPQVVPHANIFCRGSEEEKQYGKIKCSTQAALSPTPNRVEDDTYSIY